MDQQPGIKDGGGCCGTATGGRYITSDQTPFSQQVFVTQKAVRTKEEGMPPTGDHWLELRKGDLSSGGDRVE